MRRLKKRKIETMKRNPKLLGLSSLEKQKLEGLVTKQISHKAAPYSGWGDQLLCCWNQVGCKGTCVVAASGARVSYKKGLPQDFLKKSCFPWP